MSSSPLLLFITCYVLFYRSDYRRPIASSPSIFICNLNQQPPLSLSHLSSFCSCSGFGAVRFFPHLSQHHCTPNPTSTPIHTTTTHNRRSPLVYFLRTLSSTAENTTAQFFYPSPPTLKPCKNSSTLATHSHAHMTDSTLHIPHAPFLPPAASFWSIIYSHLPAFPHLYVSALRSRHPDPTRCAHSVAACVARARTPPSLHLSLLRALQL